MERIKIHNDLIAILEQGVLTANLSVDPKKSLHVEETDKTPLISSEPSESRLQETATVPARAASFLIAGPPTSPHLSVEPSNNAVSLLSWNLTKSWASEEEKKKVALNQEQTCCHMGNGDTVAKGSGPTGKGQRALLVCITESFSFPLYPSVIPKRADKATVELLEEFPPY